MKLYFKAFLLSFRTLVLPVLLPLSFIVFVFISKWWYVVPIDGRGILMRGFPLPFMAQAMHTSMAYHFFAIELFLDFLFYFFIVLLLFGFLFRFEPKFYLPIFVRRAIQVLSVLLWLLVVFFLANPNHLLSLYIPYEYKVIHTGFNFIFSNNTEVID